MSTKRSTSAAAPLFQWLAIALIVILADQFTKILIVGNFQLGGSVTVTSFFNVVRWHNTGAAFNFLAHAAGWQRWFFVGLGTAATLFIIWLLRRHGQQKLFAWALSLILGGAIGNVIDRLVHGYVVDFISIHYQDAWTFPAFNIADSAITIGAVLLIWDELRRVRRG
ncbi:signal peptidase II [Paucibacter sp. APW11]|uniref:Lipoprotein signal peptidase n=1 Tax=Roseateles aquae TaxID=3077235 RepID=A0ABU3P6F2_9BURK|nr:signal peptidase II [Paucibacter sp. APW11]MDT8998148.1 signal peptidase II [Paucibacter sp. APW11]